MNEKTEVNAVAIALFYSNSKLNSTNSYTKLVSVSEMPG